MRDSAVLIITKNKAFSQALSNSLQGKVSISSVGSVPSMISKATQIIFCDSNFSQQVSSHVHTAHVVSLFFTEDIVAIPDSEHFYLIDQNSNPDSVAAIIAKNISSYSFNKSCIFTTQIIDSSKFKGLVFLVDQKKKETPEIVNKPVVPKALFKKVVASPLPKQKRYKLRILGAVTLFCVWMLLLPLATLGLSGGLLALSAHEVKAFRIKNANLLLKIDAPLSSFTYKSALTLSQVPVIGEIYNEVVEISNVENLGISVVRDAIDILSPIIATNSISSLKLNIAKIDKLNRDGLYFFAQFKRLSIAKTIFPSLSRDEKALSMFSLLVNATQRPDLFLGEQGVSNYLILLQNNMELRPTGGFIGSFALASVDHSSFSGYHIYDVYDADGQLNGYIAPPDPIQKYLREASWKMRDSNWDPDFSVSAKRALWFLDKTLNKKAIAVIGVNLETLRAVLSVVGPIQIIDYNDTIDANNFYQKIQSEVHKDFFPGTRKKSNYLTAVAQSLFAKVQEDKTDWVSILKALMASANSKDIEVFVDNTDIQKTVEAAGLAGTIKNNSVGFVEANLGVNKANQYVSRNASIYFNKEKTLNMRIEIKNNATENNDETRYRVFVRGMAPVGFKLKFLEVVAKGIEREILTATETYENRVEAGTFVEVKAGETANLTFEWENTNVNNYNSLVFWKQPGVLPFNLTVSLTGGGDRQYNTQVVSDIDIKL